ncbi:MAG: Hsp33 family molecular chaperone HslO, partial [Rhodobacteraceae bacterium]|nr:Hsp33 family molecular chaperone HslO [Paracoccaceae bacterium]
MVSAEEIPNSGDVVSIDASDLILPFQVNQLGCRGRVVRLSETVTDILDRHDYPQPVARLLAEALALTALLGGALKFEGKLSLQTRSDGPVDMLVVDYTSAGTLRAYAHFDADAITDHDALAKNATASLLGEGHLALTIDQGKFTERYQGVVPLSNTSLSEAAHTYFA